MNQKVKAAKNTNGCAKMILSVFLILQIGILTVEPACAQLLRNGSRLPTAFNRSARVIGKDVAVSSRLARTVSKPTTQVFNRTVNKQAAIQSTMTNVRSTLAPIVSRQKGTISVTAGSLGKKRTPVVKEKILKNSSIASGTTSSAAKTSQSRSALEIAELKKLPQKQMSQQAREEVGAMIRKHEQNAATARTRTFQLQFLESSRANGKANVIKLPFHKNSNKYFGPTHVYAVVGKDGKFHKIGESARATLNQKSIRAESQISEEMRKKGYSTVILDRFITKKQARAFERRLIAEYREKYGPDALPGNLSYH